MSLIRTLGKLFLSCIFITSGAQIFLTPGNRVKIVEKAGIPEPEQAVELNGAAMVVGGTLLAVDIAPRLAATVLIGALVPTTLVGHAFWKEETEAGRKAQRTQFMKNLGLIGGLLLVLAGK
ncbi:MAG TPA: DoxX family protein [Ktedonobacteraceae bacterium]|nr:DoxX family protein [Ktedonobacteraceae bacterium]